jgi:hypothetical protein
MGVSLVTSKQHNGEATLFSPPTDAFQESLPHSESDVVSVRSLETQRIAQYQRPFRWGCNLSLTDLRSVRTRLSNSNISTSTGSSGVPGIGYQSGKVVKWFGVQMLGAISQLVIFRRRRVIKMLIKRIETIPRLQRSEWVLKNEGKINRAVEELLELTM